MTAIHTKTEILRCDELLQDSVEQRKVAINAAICELHV